MHKHSKRLCLVQQLINRQLKILYHGVNYVQQMFFFLPFKLLFRAVLHVHKQPQQNVFIYCIFLRSHKTLLTLLCKYANVKDVSI